jgi:hypothetical protein
MGSPRSTPFSANKTEHRVSIGKVGLPTNKTKWENPMPALVYRITEVLSAIVIDLPIGTNLGLFHILWTLISGRLLQTRGALIPALAATGLEPAAAR